MVSIIIVVLYGGLDGYLFIERNEDDDSNRIFLDEDDANASLVSSLLLSSPAFSATSSDKGKTPVYRSNTNKTTNATSSISIANSSSTSDNISKTPQTTSNPRDNDTMNGNGPTATSYIWLYARKQQMPNGQERIFCKQAQCKSHAGWIAVGGGTGNIRRHLQTVHGFYNTPPPTAGEGPLPALLAKQESRARPPYDPSIMRNLMIRMIVRHKLPFTIFESAEYCCQRYYQGTQSLRKENQGFSCVYSANVDVKQEQGHILRSSIGYRGGIVIEVEDDDDDSIVNDNNPSGFDGGPNGDNDEHDDFDDSHDDDVTDDEDCEDDAELKTLPENRRVTGNALMKLRNGVKKIRHEPPYPSSAPDSEHSLSSIAMQSGPSSTDNTVEQPDEICWDSDVDEIDRRAPNRIEQFEFDSIRLYSNRI
ncbi:MAG: hypothetical protein J3R72DRAFT_424944 [Linnemannia gamsii]|nr:MAG: hypothetical protein J3R72DRAFT_424944 [Linnemannia gamsii]